MKAVVVQQFGPFADATVADLPIPPPATGAVIIKVDAAPVNFVDLIVISGKLNTRVVLNTPFNKANFFPCSKKSGAL